MRNYLLFMLLLVSSVVSAQELNASVSFNTDQLTATNQQIFKTLQKSITDFLNNTKWTEKKFGNNEKIECSFFLNFKTYDNVNSFTCSMQVQSSRPVFGSTYATPVLNINDKDFNFQYTEFQNMAYNPNSYDSNLISVLAFYANMIVGFDAETFALEGGTPAFLNAQNIVNLAQQTQEKSWTSSGNQNRYYLVNDILSNTYIFYRKALYDYHLNALDVMSSDSKKGKENFKQAFKSLIEVASVRPNAYLTRVFFDAKSDEIQAIFSGGPKVDITDVVQQLNKLSPTNTSKWSQITF